MSILIRGMEMPTRCWDCVLDTYGYCMASGEHSDIIPADAPIPDWCPLIPIPPHGDLIDADKLKQELRTAGIVSTYGSQVLIKIDNAPTIIPASEDGE